MNNLKNINEDEIDFSKIVKMIEIRKEKAYRKVNEELIMLY